MPLEALCIEVSSSKFSETPPVGWDQLEPTVPLQQGATGALQSLATVPLRGDQIPQGTPGLTCMHHPCLALWLGPGSRRVTREQIAFIGWYGISFVEFCEIGHQLVLIA